MQSCNTPCTGTEYPIHMGTVPLKEEEEEELATLILITYNVLQCLFGWTFVDDSS